MSYELLEELALYADAPVDDIDDGRVAFYKDELLCVIESISDVEICLDIDNEKIETDNIMEAMEFLDNVFNIDDREKAITELEDELRIEFRR